MANRIYKCLLLKFFSNSSSSRCCLEPFFIMKNACKVVSRYSNGQNTEHRMFLPSLSHIVDQFTPQTSPTLVNKRYVNNHSHFKFLM
ncbi:unnamed protein product, partial [Staurois parvus]